MRFGLVLATALSVCPGLALAVGLGDIRLSSSLNQPLVAEIELHDLRGLDSRDIQVGLASREAFASQGVERPHMLTDLRFTPQIHGDRGTIRVTSGRPIDSFYLTFIVELARPGGALLREYTVLLDPPGSVEPEPPTARPVSRPRVALAEAAPAPARPKSQAPSAPVAAESPTASPAPQTADQPAPGATGDAVSEVQAAAPAEAPAVPQAAPPLQGEIEAFEARVAQFQAAFEARDAELARLEALLRQRQAPLAVREVAAVPPASVPVSTPVPAQGTPGRMPGWLMAAAGLALLVAGWLACAWRARRGRAASAFAEVANASAPLSARADAEAPISRRRVSAKGRADSQARTLDALETASLYISAGRFAEAHRVLTFALADDPQRISLRLLLLDMLGQLGDSAAFAVEFGRLRQLGVDLPRLQDIRTRHAARIDTTTLDRPAGDTGAFDEALKTPPLPSRATTAQEAGADFHGNLHTLPVVEEMNLVLSEIESLFEQLEADEAGRSEEGKKASAA